LIGGCGPRLPYRVNVPNEFRRDPPGWIPPNGEPERVRYATAYEAFWWNCTILKSKTSTLVADLAAAAHLALPLDAAMAG